MSTGRKKRLPPGSRPNPAPAGLRLLQDFLNTRDAESGRDNLESPAALSAWLSGQSLWTTGEEPTEDQWQEALTLREGLRDLLRSRDAGSIDTEAVQYLNRIVPAVDVRQRMRFGNDGILRVTAIAEPAWHGAMWRLLLPLLQAIRGGTWRRLKICRCESCERVFYDSSKNRSGKWCNPRRCGNRINTRTYRRRGPSTRYDYSPAEIDKTYADLLSKIDEPFDKLK